MHIDVPVEKTIFKFSGWGSTTTLVSFPLQRARSKPTFSLLCKFQTSANPRFQSPRKRLMSWMMQFSNREVYDKVFSVIA